MVFSFFCFTICYKTVSHNLTHKHVNTFSQTLPGPIDAGRSNPVFPEVIRAGSFVLLTPFYSLALNLNLSLSLHSFKDSARSSFPASLPADPGRSPSNRIQFGSTICTRLNASCPKRSALRAQLFSLLLLPLYPISSNQHLVPSTQYPVFNLFRLFLKSWFSQQGKHVLFINFNSRLVERIDPKGIPT
ncbi:hypothetical protein ES705_02959 [subsurface metagenome]